MIRRCLWTRMRAVKKIQSKMDSSCPSRKLKINMMSQSIPCSKRMKTLKISNLKMTINLTTMVKLLRTRACNSRWSWWRTKKSLRRQTSRLKVFWRPIKNLLPPANHHSWPSRILRIRWMKRKMKNRRLREPWWTRAQKKSSGTRSCPSSKESKPRAS